MGRTATITRTTKETEISLTLALDGSGQAEVDTGIGFLDHMLTALARHGLFDLTVGQALLPMDEASAEAVVDLSEEFFRAFAMNGLLTLHLNRRAGRNAHHVAEACFKAAAHALRMAVEPDRRSPDTIPSTKGAL